MSKTWNVESLQVKRATSSRWSSLNPILMKGEFGLDVDNNILKIGNGVDHWDRLPFFLNSQMPRKKLADCSWAEIGAIAESGLAPMYFSVGDEKNVTLSTNESITVVILGFNHDTKTSGGKASITFGTKNSLKTTYSMNLTNTNVGGWADSNMRKTTMPLYLGYLPSDLQAVIKPVNKITSAGNLSTTLDSTSDSLFLFSMKEVFCTNKYSATTAYSVDGEGEQYDYFKKYPIPKPNSGNGKFSALIGNTGTLYTSNTSVASGYKDRFGTTRSTSTNVYYHYGNTKGLGDTATSANSWWLRSPYSSSSTGFCSVVGSGIAVNSTASYTLGVAFGFCI